MGPGLLRHSTAKARPPRSPPARAAHAAAPREHHAAPLALTAPPPSPARAADGVPRRQAHPAAPRPHRRRRREEAPELPAEASSELSELSALLSAGPVRAVSPASPATHAPRAARARLLHAGAPARARFENVSPLLGLTVELTVVSVRQIVVLAFLLAFLLGGC